MEICTLFSTGKRLMSCILASQVSLVMCWMLIQLLSMDKILQLSLRGTKKLLGCLRFHLVLGKIPRSFPLGRVILIVILIIRSIFSIKRCALVPWSENKIRGIVLVNPSQIDLSQILIQKLNKLQEQLLKSRKHLISKCLKETTKRPRLSYNMITPTKS